MVASLYLHACVNNFHYSHGGQKRKSCQNKICRWDAIIARALVAGLALHAYRHTDGWTYIKHACTPINTYVQSHTYILMWDMCACLCYLLRVTSCSCGANQRHDDQQISKFQTARHCLLFKKHWQSINNCGAH